MADEKENMADEEEYKPDIDRVSVTVFIFTFATLSHLFVSGILGVSKENASSSPPTPATFSPPLTAHPTDDPAWYMKAWTTLNLMAIIVTMAALLLHATQLVGWRTPLVKSRCGILADSLLWIGYLVMGFAFLVLLGGSSGGTKEYSFENNLVVGGCYFGGITWFLISTLKIWVNIPLPFGPNDGQAQMPPP